MAKNSFNTTFCMYKLVWMLSFSLVMLLLIFDQFGGISVSLVDNMTLKLSNIFFKILKILWLIPYFKRYTVKNYVVKL